MSDGLSDSKNLVLDKQFRRRYFRVSEGRGITMECPKNKDHMGIKVVKLKGGQKQVSPHYAKVICKVCNEWIKWLSKADYQNAMDGTGSEEVVWNREAEEPTDTEETDVERMVRCIDDAVTIERNCFIKTKTHGDPFLILQIAFKLFDGREK